MIMPRCDGFVVCRLLPALRLLAVVLPCASPALGGTALYWDANGTSAGAGATPTGTWGTSSYWNSDPTGGTSGSFVTTTSLDERPLFRCQSEQYERH